MTKVIESGRLDLGVVIDGAVHRDFTLRPAVLADTYRAVEWVTVPVDIDSNQAANVAYQMAVDDGVILCQLESLGTLATPLPSPAALAAVLDPDDMGILRGAAAILKKKLRASRSSSPPIDEPNTSSSAPAID